MIAAQTLRRAVMIGLPVVKEARAPRRHRGDDRGACGRSAPNSDGTSATVIARTILIDVPVLGDTEQPCREGYVKLATGHGVNRGIYD